MHAACHLACRSVLGGLGDPDAPWRPDTRPRLITRPNPVTRTFDHHSDSNDVGGRGWFSVVCVMSHQPRARKDAHAVDRRREPATRRAGARTGPTPPRLVSLEHGLRLPLGGPGGIPPEEFEDVRARPRAARRSFPGSHSFRPGAQFPKGPSSNYCSIVTWGMHSLRFVQLLNCHGRRLLFAGLLGNGALWMPRMRSPAAFARSSVKR
jgi:hypothetical protein